MKPLSTPAAEAALAAAVGALALAAVLAPATGLPAGYHDFADQRGWHGLPNAMDVLSNAPFAALGVWGLAWLRRAATRVGAAQRALAALFFVGLIATAACSAGYYMHPDHAGLCLDRDGRDVVGHDVVQLSGQGYPLLVADLELLPTPQVGPVAKHRGQRHPQQHQDGAAEDLGPGGG